MYELAVSEDYENASGKYFDSDYPKGTLYAERLCEAVSFRNPLGRDRGTFEKAHPDAYDEKKIDKLIGTTMKILAD